MAEDTELTIPMKSGKQTMRVARLSAEFIIGAVSDPENTHCGTLRYHQALWDFRS